MNGFGSLHLRKTPLFFRRCLQYQSLLSKLFSGPVPVHSIAAKLVAPKVDALTPTTDRYVLHM
jgi:hypothetical protein